MKPGQQFMHPDPCQLSLWSVDAHLALHSLPSRSLSAVVIARGSYSICSAEGEVLMSWSRLLIQQSWKTVPSLWLA